jgi:predicted acylesterase/phospholipase RssA
VFGTSTGAIIASLIALGYEIDEIHALYKTYVPRVMQIKNAQGKSEALAELAQKVFGDTTFEDVKTGIGVVCTKWVIERPMIFKGDVAQAHGRLGTFKPGFGVSIADAVQASCSAYPFFDRKVVTTAAGDKVELIDGGYCANNPTLYAIADAVIAMKKDRGDLRVVNVGVGVYPEPKPRGWKMRMAKKYLVSVQLLQKTLEINTQSMDQLRTILFKDIMTIRVNDTFEKPEMATDLMEHDLDKLNILRQRGSESFASREKELKEFLM